MPPPIAPIIAPVLKAKHPANNNIKAKIRQQLQFLRDKDLLEFIGDGRYKLKTEET
jgi:type II restriction enzyme